MFAKIKTIFENRNTSFYRNFDQQPLIYIMDNSILIEPIHLQESIRMKRLKRGRVQKYRHVINQSKQGERQ